jgi:hypothetical protein
VAGSAPVLLISKRSSFIQDLTFDQRQIMQLGLRHCPFETFTTIRLRERPTRPDFRQLCMAITSISISATRSSAPESSR